MTEKICIQIDATEILDRVDDMLAWEAIASYGPLGRYYADHFKRAEPLVHLGNQTWGTMTPASLEVGEAQQYAPETAFADFLTDDDFELEIEDTAPKMVSMMNYRLCYARLMERERDDSVFAAVGLGGDHVPEFEHPKLPGYAWSNVRYHLESIAELNGSLLKRYANAYRFPQAARVFLRQHVLAFQDGRASNGAVLIGFWNGRFFNTDRMPMKGVNSQALAFYNTILDQFDRDQNWIVELSLTQQRTGVGLRTDAVGARELANMLRGSDTSAGRRKTLVHWVNEHMRRRRALDPEATIKVRSHFRGKNGLDAGRYHLRIWPASEKIAAASNGARFDFSQEGAW
jgi:hypothetical protein